MAGGLPLSCARSMKVPTDTVGQSSCCGRLFTTWDGGSRPISRAQAAYIAPVGGGKATVGETTVRTISPSSPLGEAMVELEVGDAFEVDSPRGLLAFEVSDIG